MARLFPRTLAEVVGKAAKPIFRKRGFAETSLLLEWPSIVGELLASHCTPLSVSFPRNENTNGTLTIVCSPAFAPELQQLTPMLLEKIATHMGYRAITRVLIEQRHQPRDDSTLKKVTKTTITEDSLSNISADDNPVASALARLEKIRHLGKHDS